MQLSDLITFSQAKFLLHDILVYETIRLEDELCDRKNKGNATNAIEARIENLATLKSQNLENVTAYVAGLLETTLDEISLRVTSVDSDCHPSVIQERIEKIESVRKCVAQYRRYLQATS